MPHVTVSSGAACCAGAAWVLGSGRPRFSRRWPLRRRRKGHGPPRQTRHGRRRGAWVTALRMEVRRLNVEADVPASAVPTTGREQDPGPRRHHELPGARIVLRDGTEQPPQPTGVVMYTNRADLRQSHRAGMTFPDPDQPGAATARLIAEPEALAATTFALVPREADPPSLDLGDPTLFVGHQGATKVNGGFLEYLCRYFTLPYQAGNVLGDGCVRSDNEAASSGLASRH